MRGTFAIVGLAAFSGVCHAGDGLLLVSADAGVRDERAAQPAAASARKALKSTLDEVRMKTGAPGMAAAVVRDGRVIGLGVSGVREMGTDGAIEETDSFVIGSCTKAMTRLLLARMADAGEITFDARLPELLPGVAMRDEYRPMTLTNLAQHTAGLPAYTRITPKDTPIVFELKGSPQEQRTAFAAHVLMENPSAPPGTKFVYSNASYSLLGNIAERRAGKAWEDLMTERVFTPLGMTGMTFGRPREEAGKPVVVGHRKTPGGFEPARMGPPLAGLFAPAGAVCLPIEQFAKFAAMEANVEAGSADGFLSKGVLTRMPGLLPADMAKGEGQPFFGGEGSFTAAFATWPSKHLGVVVCTNAGDSDEICVAAIEAVLAACAPEVKVGSAGPAAGARPRLGIQMRGEDDGRLVVDEVEKGSIAEKIGFKKDDEVQSVNGKAVAEWEQGDLVAAIRTAGTKISLLRGGKTVEVVVP